MTTPQVPSNKLLQLIHTQTQIAQLGLDLYAVMNLVANRSLELIDGDGSAIEFIEGDDLTYHAVAGSLDHLLGYKLNRNASLSGVAISSRNYQVCYDSETNEQVNREATRRLGVRSMVIVPLAHHDKILGVLKVTSKTVNHFDEQDAELLSMLSDMIGASMYYATKYGADELFLKATTDPLSQLANRRLFMDRLQNYNHIAEKTHSAYAVLIIDIDNLKPLNDKYGHTVGDAAIKTTAQRIEQSIHSRDTAARVGGDEFAVLSTVIETPEQARELVEKIDKAIQMPFQQDGVDIPLIASIGVASYPHDSTDPMEIYEIADRRMYSHKRQRKIAD